jgi:phenylacetate-CoA ligase
VRYRTASGDWLNNIEITHAFRDLALSQWSLHQAADGSLTLRHAGSNAMGAEAEAKLRSLFGGNVITVSPLPSDGTKLIQYTSDIADPST